MITILSAFVSLLSFRVRSRASLELELVALRHQVTVLRRQRPGRARLLCADRLLWVWLYQVWPQILNAMVLVRPATVIQWHRKGFRLYWRWRSRHLGRPKIDSEAVSKPTEARQYQSSGTTKSLKKRDFEIAKQRATLLLNASAEGFETDSQRSVN
jgi:hypothetical protein